MTHNTIDFPVKHPSSVLDYEFDWSDWLPTGDTIDSVVWTIAPSGGLTEVAHSNTGTSARIWLSGGTDGQSVTIACKITTSNVPARVETAYGRIRVQT